MIALQAAIPVVFFDILGNGFGIDPSRLLELDRKEILRASRHIDQQLKDLGYKTPIAIINLGSVSWLYLFYFV